MPTTRLVRPRGAPGRITEEWRAYFAALGSGTAGGPGGGGSGGSGGGGAPHAHAATHAPGGSDVITSLGPLTSIGTSGPWAPVLTASDGASGQVYSIQTGSFTKVGRLVFIEGRIILSTVGTVTGTVRLGGLPFPAAMDNTDQGCVAFGWFAGLAAPVAGLTATILAGTTFASLQYVPAGGASGMTGLPASGLSPIGVDFLFAGRYTA